MTKTAQVSQGFWVTGGGLERRAEEGFWSQVQRREGGIPTNHQEYLPTGLEWENAAKNLPICHPRDRPLKIQFFPRQLSRVIGDPGRAKEQTVAGTGCDAEWS